MSDIIIYFENIYMCIYMYVHIMYIIYKYI